MGPNDSEQFYETPEDDSDLKRTKFKLSKLIYITRARFEEIINKSFFFEFFLNLNYFL